jgi:hypothetical protein
MCEVHRDYLSGSRSRSSTPDAAVVGTFDAGGTDPVVIPDGRHVYLSDNNYG